STEVLKDHPQNAIAWAVRGMALLHVSFALEEAQKSFATGDQSAAADGAVADVKAIAAAHIMNKARTRSDAFFKAISAFEAAEYNRIYQMYSEVYRMTSAAYSISPSLGSEIAEILDKIDLSLKSL